MAMTTGKDRGMASPVFRWPERHCIAESRGRHGDIDAGRSSGGGRLEQDVAG
jgi:hypothetical protein